MTTALTKKNKSTYTMSKRRRNGIIIGCLLLIVVFVWLDHKWQLQPSDFEKYHGKSSTVVKVIDGDTIDIAIPDGRYEQTRIRLWGVDAPGSKTEEYGPMYFGLQATEFTEKLTLGKTVTVYLDKDNRSRDKYGRLLAYVQLPDGRFLNEVLIAEGFAYADLRFRHSFYNKYKQLEASARSLKKGLWQKVKRDQLPEWLQKEKPNLLRKK